MTVFWSCWKIARCRSRTAERKTLWNTLPADQPVDDALDHRADGDQVRPRVDHEIVGDPGGDLGTDGLVVERRARPVGELVRIEQGAVRVTNQGRDQQQDGRQDRQRRSGDPSARGAHAGRLSAPSTAPWSGGANLAATAQGTARHSVRRRATRSPRGPDQGRRGGRPARFRLDPPVSARCAARLRRGARGPPGAGGRRRRRRRPRPRPRARRLPGAPPRPLLPLARHRVRVPPRSAAAPRRPAHRGPAGLGSLERRAASGERRAGDRRRERRRARGGRSRRQPAPNRLRPLQGRGDRPRRRRRAARRGRLRARRPGRRARPVLGPRRHPRRVPGDRGARRPPGAVRRRDRVDPVVLDLHAALAGRGRADRARPGRRARARAPRARRAGRNRGRGGAPRRRLAAAGRLVPGSARPDRRAHRDRDRRRRGDPGGAQGPLGRRDHGDARLRRPPPVRRRRRPAPGAGDRDRPAASTETRRRRAWPDRKRTRSGAFRRSDSEPRPRPRPRAASAKPSPSSRRNCAPTTGPSSPSRAAARPSGPATT